MNQITCLMISVASLILQAPPAVFEGDLVILRCKSRVEAAASTKAINKNRKHLEFLGESSEFHIHNASLKDNGDYHCTELRKECCNASSNTVKIQVQGKAIMVWGGDWSKGRSLGLL